MLIKIIKIVDFKKVMLIKIIEKTENPYNNFINCNSRRSIMIEQNDKASDSDTLFFSSSSSEDEKS